MWGTVGTPPPPGFRGHWQNVDANVGVGDVLLLPKEFLSFYCFLKGDVAHYVGVL